MWPVVANPDLVLQELGDPQIQTHSGPAAYGSRQAIQARPDHPNQEVSSRGFPVDMHQVAATSNRPIYDKVQQGISVCVTSSTLPSLGRRSTQSTLGGPGPICLSSSIHSGQGGGKTQQYQSLK